MIYYCKVCTKELPKFYYNLCLECQTKGYKHSVIFSNNGNVISYSINWPIFDYECYNSFNTFKPKDLFYKSYVLKTVWDTTKVPKKINKKNLFYLDIKLPYDITVDRLEKFLVLL